MAANINNYLVLNKTNNFSDVEHEIALYNEIKAKLFALSATSKVLYDK
jgi:cytochrome c oxidase subunit IV